MWYPGIIGPERTEFQYRSELLGGREYQRRSLKEENALRYRVWKKHLRLIEQQAGYDNSFSEIFLSWK